jgi:hypothetical protein
MSHLIVSQLSQALTSLCVISGSRESVPLLGFAQIRRYAYAGFIALPQPELGFGHRIRGLWNGSLVGGHHEQSNRLHGILWDTLAVEVTQAEAELGR